MSSNLTVSAISASTLFQEWHADCESLLTMNDQEIERTFHAFALACRVERDRIARVRLAEEDHRFESATAERAEADRQAARLIAAISR